MTLVFEPRPESDVSDKIMNLIAKRQRVLVLRAPGELYYGGISKPMRPKPRQKNGGIHVIAWGVNELTSKRGFFKNYPVT